MQEAFQLEHEVMRKSDDRLIGHSPIRTQIGWCKKEGVKRAVITHLGSQVVEGDERALGARLQEWADARGLQAAFAHDGMELVLR
jgi:hypothetical protein